ncbi:putative Cupin 2 [Seiridium unicorne]|uniref:Cupin 2 n=1 Tax=Seiridium unicorne TaxID=138068 RepID=A0ABR2URM3_9PEZI
MSAAYNLPAPKRIIASNLPLPVSAASDAQVEPGVEVRVDTLSTEVFPGGIYHRSRVATAKKVPASNDGSGDIPLDDIPGAGIVLPGGINIYYMDVAPKSEGPMHRTTSTDYLVVLQGQLSLLTPGPAPYSLKDGNATYGEPVETICGAGEVIQQRGMMHALSNRTDNWIRIIGFVVGSDANRVPVGDGSAAGGEAQYKALEDAWLQ